MAQLKYQYYVAGVITLGGFSLGNVLGWSSPAVADLEKNGGTIGNLESSQLSWVASLANIGALCGAILSGFLIEKFGRCATLCLVGVTFSTGWMMLSLSSDLSMLYIGRIVTGMALGGFSLTTPVYLSEVAEPTIRGLLVAVYMISATSGILFTSIIGAMSSWQTLTLCCLVSPFLFTIFVSTLPESPRYLLSKGRKVAARKSLLKLGHIPSKCVDSELSQMEKEIESESKSKDETFNFSQRIRPNAIRALLISTCLMALNQLCGANAVGFYTVTIFEHVGLGLDAHLSSIVVGVVQVVATAVAAFTVDKVGRRILLMVSFAVMTFSLVILGTFFFLDGEGRLPEEEEVVYWIPLVVVVLFNFSYYGGVGVVVWTLMGEVLPQNIVGFGSGLATALNWGLAFLTTRFFLDISNALGIHFSFWLFAGASLLGFLFALFLVKETKGMSLNSIQTKI